MAQEYRTLRVTPGEKGVLGVVIDAPPMNLPHYSYRRRRVLPRRRQLITA